MAIKLASSIKPPPRPTPPLPAAQPDAQSETVPDEATKLEGSNGQALAVVPIVDSAGVVVPQKRALEEGELAEEEPLPVKQRLDEPVPSAAL